MLRQDNFKRVSFCTFEVSFRFTRKMMRGFNNLNFSKGVNRSLLLLQSSFICMRGVFLTWARRKAFFHLRKKKCWNIGGSAMMLGWNNITLKWRRKSLRCAWCSSIYKFAMENSFVSYMHLIWKYFNGLGFESEATNDWQENPESILGRGALHMFLRLYARVL